MIVLLASKTLRQANMEYMYISASFDDIDLST